MTRENMRILYHMLHVLLLKSVREESKQSNPSIEKSAEELMLKIGKELYGT